MPIYLACGAQEPLPPLPAPFVPAQLGFRLAEDYPSLLGPEPGSGATREYLVLQDDLLPPYAPTPALARLLADLCAESFGGLICDFDKEKSDFWQALTQLLDGFAAQRSLPLFVPEAYAAEAPHALVMLPSGVPEAGFGPWLQEMAAQYPARAILQLLPTRLELALPCPCGSGQSLSREALGALLSARSPAIFRDEALACEYFGFLQEERLHFVLFDSAQTLAQKVSMAESAGFAGVIGLYQELKDLLPRGQDPS